MMHELYNTFYVQVAILDPDTTLDFESLAHGVTKSLPSYARPLFVRIVKHLDMTGK
jgi:solute carrier family 27 fatty acid transporter 1/4